MSVWRLSVKAVGKGSSPASKCLSAMRDWKVVPMWVKWINPNTLNFGVKHRSPLPKISPPVIQMSGRGDVCGDWIPVSFFSNHLLFYLWWEFGRGELLESVQTHSILVWKIDSGHQAKFVPTHDLKIGCSDHFLDESPISTLSNYSLCLWWKIERVKLMWIAWINPRTHHILVRK